MLGVTIEKPTIMHHEEVEFRRDCVAVAIPQGHRVTIPQGARGWVTQALGSMYTLQVPSLGGLFRIDGDDADAIGQAPAKSESDAPGTRDSGAPLGEQAIWEQLRTVYDPEIPINVVDLGLIYDLGIEQLPSGRSRVRVSMTLTAPGCGMGPAIATDAKTRIERLPGVEEAHVQLVWDPPWNPHMISPEGRAKLGMD
jgi:probable FeS assembly SUF system protein SufT